MDCSREDFLKLTDKKRKELGLRRFYTCYKTKIQENQNIKMNSTLIVDNLYCFYEKRKALKEKKRY